MLRERTLEPAPAAGTGAVGINSKESGHAVSPTFLDLFSGCGGFTLGMQRAGFRCLAAIDFNEQAITTLHANLPNSGQVLLKDLSVYAPKELAALIGTNNVDVIVGGPPCQGFSTARQVDGANHGKRLTDDPRRHLYKDLLRFVEHFQPKVFVMENVLGMRTAGGGAYFTAVQNEARNLGKQNGGHAYRVHSQIEDAWELGVPQKRRRQLIVGVRSDLPGYFLPRMEPAPRATARITLGPVIGDLPILRAGGGEDERTYDRKRLGKHLKKYGAVAKSYLEDVLEIKRCHVLTNHVARPHSDRDLWDFDQLREGESSAVAMRRGVDFLFPYDKTTFKDRYTRQSRQRPCSTIVAHLSKDGLMFIHPTQCRSITPREAARVQSFPDWFRFPAAKTHSFRLIGNAVPPLVAEAVGLAIKKFLATQHDSLIATNRQPRQPIDLEKSESVLISLIGVDKKTLRALPAVDFFEAWRTLLILFPELHPCNAKDHGHELENSPHEGESTLNKLCAERYRRSGWPVSLAAFGDEAWRRYSTKQMDEQTMFHLACK
jgi:DNA (cytosine-5)-methyltransferase 1